MARYWPDHIAAHPDCSRPPVSPPVSYVSYLVTFAATLAEFSLKVPAARKFPGPPGPGKRFEPMQTAKGVMKMSATKALAKASRNSMKQSASDSTPNKTAKGEKIIYNRVSIHNLFSRVLAT